MSFDDIRCELLEVLKDMNSSTLEMVAQDLGDTKKLIARVLDGLLFSLETDLSSWEKRDARGSLSLFSIDAQARARFAHAAELLPRLRELAATTKKIASDFSRDISADAIGLSERLLREYAELNIRLLLQTRAMARAAGASVLTLLRKEMLRVGTIRRRLIRMTWPIEAWLASFYGLSRDEARAILDGAELVAANDEEAAVFFVDNAADTDAATDAATDVADTDADTDATDAAAASSSCQPCSASALTAVRRRIPRALSV